jgi:pSer/pThr/pTyr-binding forkhead associated (FHA) protein
MSVTFRLTSEKEPGQRQELSFEDETVSIGRDTANKLLLKSTLVSKHHAEIQLRDQSYTVEDLGSTNGTYVNNKRLAARTRHALHLGDRVRIGDCYLEVVHLSVLSRPERAKPVVISVSQSETPRVEKEPAASSESEAIDERNVGPRSDEANPEQRIAILQGRVQQLEIECRLLREENVRLESSAENRSRVAEAAPLEFVESHIVETFRVFLRAFSRLARGRLSFYNEFVGTTFVRGGHSLLENLENNGVAFLAAESLPEEEVKNRRTLLGKELDDAALHSLALLEGYRKGIETGTRRLLDRLSPDLINEELKNAKLRVGSFEIPYRYLPIVRELKVRQIVRRRVQELIGEDRGVLEKRYYRDGFIQGYQMFLGARKSPEFRAEK